MPRETFASWLTSFADLDAGQQPTSSSSAQPPAASSSEDHPDPIAGGQEQSAGANAMEYPIPGVINDIDSKTYLMSPDYWVYWNRVHGPPTTKTGASAPPAAWWQQREDWRDTWERLATGHEGRGTRWNPRQYPMPAPASKKLGEKSRWWKWLDGRKPPLEDQGLDANHKSSSSTAVPGAAKGADTGVQENPCEGGLFPNPALPGSDKALKTPGCFCPGPNCVFDNRNADERPGPPLPGKSNPPEDIVRGFYGGAYPEQLDWLNQHSMRRQTLPGLSDALSNKPNALRQASVRLDRTQDGWGKQPATLDPRPGMPVGNPWLPMLKKQPTLEPYTGGGGMFGAAKKYAGKALLDEAAGANMLEMKAFMRLQNKSHGEWLQNLMKFKKAEQAYEDGNEQVANEIMHEGKAEEAVMAHRQSKRGAKQLMEKPSEPTWQPPPPERFEDLYEARYRRFWPAMEVLARRQGAGPARVVKELGQEWRAQRVSPPRQFNEMEEIFKSSRTDIRSANTALGLPAPENEAIEQELPIPQPDLRQALLSPHNGVTSSRPAVVPKAYLGTEVGLPPPVSKASQMEEAPQRSIQDERWVQMHPAGFNGRGVEAKVPIEAIRSLYPEFDDRVPLRPTTYSGMDFSNDADWAAMVSSSWNDMQALVRLLRLTSHRRKIVADCASFL